MKKTAVLFSSGFGNTKKTALHIAGRLDAEAFNIGRGVPPGPSSCERIPLGTGLFAGRPDRTMASFVRGNREMLGRLETSLSICCSACGEEGAARYDGVSKELGIEDAVSFPKGSNDIGKGPAPDVDRSQQGL